MESSGTRAPQGSGAWASWVAFAAILLMLSGVFSVIAGLAAAFEDDYFVRGTEVGEVYLLNTTALGIFWIVFGVIKVWAGVALIQGREWARILTLVICFFHAVVNLLSLTTQPFISLLFIVFNVIIIYAITVKWQEAKIGMGD
jgi:uncharacterized membrane protein